MVSKTIATSGSLKKGNGSNTRICGKNRKLTERVASIETIASGGSLGKTPLETLGDPSELTGLPYRLPQSTRYASEAKETCERRRHDPSGVGLGPWGGGTTVQRANGSLPFGRACFKGNPSGCHVFWGTPSLKTTTLKGKKPTVVTPLPARDVSWRQICWGICFSC